MFTILHSIIDMLLPRHCLMCGAQLHGEERQVCKHCNASLPRTKMWKKAERNIITEQVNTKIFDRRLPFLELQRGASFLYHYPRTDTAEMIYEFKYRGNPGVAVDLGRLMAKEMGEAFFEGVDMLVPVPMIKKKYRTRGYNQTEMLAKGVEKVTGIPVRTDIVKRVRHKESQTRLASYERGDAVRGDFALCDGAMERATGKHLMLIDDVITTGATTAACIRVIMPVPEVKISLMSWACIKRYFSV